MTLLRLIMLLLCIAGCMPATRLQAQIPESPNARNATGAREGAWTVLYDYVRDVTEDFEDARYYAVITYHNGRPVGTTQLRFLTGELCWEGALSQAQPFVPEDGHHVFLNRGGTKECEYTLVHGRKHGEEIEYWPNGRVKFSEQYVDGNRHGPSRAWMRSGRRWFEGRYVNGKAEGLHVQWYGGAERVFSTDKHGRMVEKIDTTGSSVEQKMGESNWHNGKRDGLDLRWYRNGMPQSVMLYKDGVPIGMQVNYDRDGNMSEGPPPRFAGEGEDDCEVNGRMVPVRKYSWPPKSDSAKRSSKVP